MENYHGFCGNVLVFRITSLAKKTTQFSGCTKQLKSGTEFLCKRRPAGMKQFHSIIPYSDIEEFKSKAEQLLH